MGSGTFLSGTLTTWNILEPWSQLEQNPETSNVLDFQNQLDLRGVELGVWSKALEDLTFWNFVGLQGHQDITRRHWGSGIGRESWKRNSSSK